MAILNFNLNQPELDADAINFLEKHRKNLPFLTGRAYDYRQHESLSYLSDLEIAKRAFSDEQVEYDQHA